MLRMLHVFSVLSCKLCVLVIISSQHINAMVSIVCCSLRQPRSQQRRPQGRRLRSRARSRCGRPRGAPCRRQWRPRILSSPSWPVRYRAPPLKVQRQGLVQMRSGERPCSTSCSKPAPHPQRRSSSGCTAFRLRQARHRQLPERARQRCSHSAPLLMLWLRPRQLAGCKLRRPRLPALPARRRWRLVLLMADSEVASARAPICSSGNQRRCKSRTARSRQRPVAPSSRDTRCLQLCRIQCCRLR